MTKTSSSSETNRLGVFDFNQEDEKPELAARKLTLKFENPKLYHTSNLKKNKLLPSVPNGQAKQVSAPPCVDIGSVDSDHSCENAVCCAPTEDGDFLQSNSCKDEQNIHCQTDNNSTPARTDVSGSQQLYCASLEYPSTIEAVDTACTDADERNGESSSLDPSSDVAEDSVSSTGDVSDYCSREGEMNDMDAEVLLFPDYIVFRDKYCTASRLAFSRSCIKMFSTGVRSQSNFAYKWDIDDVVNVECQWERRTETAMVKLHVVSRDVLEAGNVVGTSGMEELKLAVVDPNWSGTQEHIFSLNLNYKDVWKTFFEDEGSEDNMLAHESKFYAKPYFPIFDETFEDVIYPKGDADAVSLTKRDVDLLQPETFINDTIIDFYVKYLKNKLQPEESHRFHFFNSFFFRKLADMDKDPSKASDGRAAFLRVRKWTRKVNLFEKDYIFVPVNFNLHWSLIVICHAGEVIKFEDKDVDKSCRVPCILHMDSIKGSHVGLKEIIQSYLWEEWKEKQKEKFEDLSSKFYNLRFVSLEVPQQENFYDCGLFLLHFVERFLEEAPLNFNPLTLSKLSNFLNTHWFPPSEASLKRADIQRLIYELLETNSGETSSAGCRDEQRFKFAENNENETCVEFNEGTGCPSKGCDGKLLSRDSGHGIKMTLLASSSLRSSQCVNDSGLVLREFITPGATTVSYDEQCQSFDPTTSFHHDTIASIAQEEAVCNQHFVNLTPDACTLTYPCADFRVEGASWSTGISMELPGHDTKNSESSPGSCASDDSPQCGSHKISPVKENASENQRRNVNQSGSPVAENIACFAEHLTYGSSGLDETAEDLQIPDQLLPCNKNEDPCLTFQEKPSALFSQVSKMEENKDISCDGTRFNELMLDSEQPAKRLRLTPPIDGESGLTEILSGDLHL